MRKISLTFFFITMMFLVFSTYANACPTCGCTVCLLGKHEGLTTESADQRWYFRYLYDQVNWHRQGAEEVNQDVSNGHDLHGKTTEQTQHFEFGRHFTDNLNVFIDVPYVVRKALEIADSSNLGAKQTSKGLGDLQVIGSYRVWHNDKSTFNFVGGIKFPTGNTHEKNSTGERFETDMQPGSGAENYIIGGVYKIENGQWSIATNTSYVFTTKGAQDFQFGNLFTASIYAGYSFNPDSKMFRTHLALDTVYQDEKKERQDGEKNPDMGGQTVFIGPAFKVDTIDNFSFTGNFLYPVSRNLNGLAQKVDFEWTLGGELKF